MKKVFLDYTGWKAILFSETGLPSMEKELFDNISKLTSCTDVTVILTEDDKPTFVLKYDTRTRKFSESQIGEI